MESYGMVKSTKMTESELFYTGTGNKKALPRIAAGQELRRKGDQPRTVPSARNRGRGSR